MIRLLFKLLDFMFGEVPGEHVNSKEVRKILSNRNDALLISNAIEEGKEEFTVTLSDNKQYKLKRLSKTTIL